VPVLRALVGAACVALAGTAAADVYKCKGNDGVPIYQETPCPKGQALRDFQADPPQITILPSPELKAPEGKAPAARTPPPAREAEPPRAKAVAKDAAKEAAAPAANERKFLRSGMSAAEVRARAGAPDATARSARGRTERWSYMPTDADPDTITSLTLVDGVVTDVERKLVRR
jgi:hypothetical protein